MLRLIRFSFSIALLLALTAAAAADCGPFVSPSLENANLGPGHHPVGKPMPASSSFNQPDACGEGIWYYDVNRNGLVDPAEPRLFGLDKMVACASCHGESPDNKSAASTSVFLRQDAAKLCLVCHNQ